MNGLLFLIPAALFLGLCGLAAFLWALKSGQYEDLDGASYRALFEEDEAQTDNETQKPEGQSPTRSR